MSGCGVLDVLMPDNSSSSIQNQQVYNSWI